jgi:hypothetical protein
MARPLAHWKNKNRPLEFCFPALILKTRQLALRATVKNKIKKKLVLPY